MINITEFKIPSPPEYHPATQAYATYWREQKRRCIEGFWVSGKWMPGKLYFYINFGTIKLNKRGSKVKSFGRPFLRDLEWEFFYNWAEARGFSGFAEDENYTCYREINNPDYPEEFKRTYAPHAFKLDGTPKEFVPAREYLRKVHDANYGRPLFENEAKDFMMMGSRGFGKSYSVGVGIVAHEWLFNGSTHYTEESRANPTPAEILVGAGDAKYSRDILDKTKIAVERLPGACEFGGVSYPSPFAQQYSGSWMPGSQVVASYKEKIGGNWENKGSQSNIKHRTFKDNPFAANGTRPGVMVMEEIGMFDNLRESRAASVECMRDGHYKFGSCMYLGTGGDMNGGGTLDASLMFYDPEKYDLLAYNDTWEHRGKIGYFVPAYLGLNAFKEELGPGVYGKTDNERAQQFLAKHRDKLRGTKSGSDALDAELQNRPVIPSEIFLTRTGNIFPIADLQNRLRQLEENDSYTYVEKKVELFYDQKSAFNGVNYKVDTRDKLQHINRFPWTEGQREGAVVIYELPQLIDGKVPEGAYIIGHDPYATDDPEGGSLAATYILKTNKYFNKIGHNEIVAQYVGRPHDGRHVYNENLLKLSLMYGNAKVYFENVRGNVKEYFEKKKKLHLLAKEPQTLFNKKAVWDTKAPTIYGFPMSSKKMKQESIQYVRDWLLEERGTDSNGKIHRNLDRIWDRAFLQELIAYQHDGNFDRVSAFIGCVLGIEEITNQNHIRMTETEREDPLKFLLDNKHLFNRLNTI
jgi:hypothetical protein